MTEYIDRAMLAYHIHSLSSGRPEEDGPPEIERLETYGDLIEGMKMELKSSCDEIPFKKGLAVLLTTKNVNLKGYCESPWGYDEDEARTLLEFIWRSLTWSSILLQPS